LEPAETEHRNYIEKGKLRDLSTNSVVKVMEIDMKQKFQRSYKLVYVRVQREHAYYHRGDSCPGPGS